MVLYCVLCTHSEALEPRYCCSEIRNENRIFIIIVVVIVCVIARFRLTGLILSLSFFVHSIAHLFTCVYVCTSQSLCVRLFFFSHFLAHVTAILFTLMSMCRMMSLCVCDGGSLC